MSSGNIDYLGPNFWQNADGQYSLDLDGNTPGAISQTFDTNIGDNYTISFYMAGNPFGGSAVKQMSVTAGAATQDYTFDVASHSDTSMGWTLNTLNFTATGTSSTVTFTSLDPANNAYGPALDNVSVADNGAGAVPEPGSLLLTLGGGAALLARRRLARRSF